MKRLHGMMSIALALLLMYLPWGAAELRHKRPKSR